MDDERWTDFWLGEEVGLVCLGVRLSLISVGFGGSGCVLAGALLMALGGCKGVPVPVGLVTGHDAVSVETARAQMEMIPPPSKNRYMAIHSLTSWENPYITAQGEMVTLHVLLADANTSGMGEGTLLRPVGARRQDLNVRVQDLSAALNSVPQSAWPYGRVVALEEAGNIPVAARPQVRRTMEAAMGVLNDLGVVVYEWTEGGAGLR